MSAQATATVQPINERYVDVGAILDGGQVAPPCPTVGLRNDGVGLFYADAVNLLFGDPESGKTWVALAAAADELARGGRALVVDLDHNGASSIVHRLISMGVDDVVLRDPGRFRYAAPDDADHMAAVVADSLTWRPTIAIVDSLGELLPLFAASSNSADDFTRVHAATLKPLAQSGACVLVIDHPSKGAESSKFGSTGTAAKKRAISGTSIRCKLSTAFRPGHGGTAFLTISKDRHGGLRAECAVDDVEPLAATFSLSEDQAGDLTWQFMPPRASQRIRVPVESPVAKDVAELSKLDPSPTSQRDVKQRMNWGSKRAMDALRAWQSAGAPTVLPAPPLKGGGAGEHATVVLPGARGALLGAREHSSWAAS